MGNSHGSEDRRPRSVAAEANLCTRYEQGSRDHACGPNGTGRSAAPSSAKSAWITSPSATKTGRVERPGQDHLPGRHANSSWELQLVGQPGDAVGGGGRGPRPRRRSPRCLVHVEHGRDPPQVTDVRSDGAPAGRRGRRRPRCPRSCRRSCAGGRSPGRSSAPARPGSSSAGVTQRVASRTSSVVTPGPLSGRSRTNASSTSTRGRMNRPNGTTPPSAKTMSLEDDAVVGLGDRDRLLHRPRGEPDFPGRRSSGPPRP